MDGGTQISDPFAYGLALDIIAQVEWFHLYSNGC